MGMWRFRRRGSGRADLLPTSLLVFCLRGGQFAIGMWVVAEVFRLLVTNDSALGGGTGRSLDVLNVYAPADRQAYTYWVALACMAVLLVFGLILLRSRVGASLQAIRDDEPPPSRSEYR